MSHRITVVLVVALIAVLVGCGGGNGSSSSLPDTERVAALDAVGAAFEALPGQDADSDNAQMLAFLQTRPEFEAAGISDDHCVWGRFRDGQILIVVNNRRSSVGRAGGVSRAATEIPIPPGVRALSALGSCFTTSPETILGLLDDKRYTNNWPNSRDVSVDALKSVGGDGVFYIDSHGGSGYAANGDEFYSLMTTTEATIPALTLYRQDLRAGNLVYMIASHDVAGSGCTQPRHFAITKKFVRQYMTFGQKSFVFLNACSSNKPAFRQAWLDQGVSVYAGWTNDVDDSPANNAARYLFARLLGLTVFGATGAPADYLTIKQEMMAATPRLDLDTVNNAELVFTASGDFGLLAPSIRDLVADRAADTLTINGLFGRPPGPDGVVTLDGSPLTLLSWSPTRIVCALPGDGGGMVVVTVRNHASNRVVLPGGEKGCTDRPGTYRGGLIITYLRTGQQESVFGGSTAVVTEATVGGNYFADYTVTWTPDPLDKTGWTSSAQVSFPTSSASMTANISTGPDGKCKGLVIRQTTRDKDGIEIYGYLFYGNK